ncbi:MAG: pentapeptide repeat-containing protein [Stenotrophomonas sp.]
MAVQRLKPLPKKDIAALRARWTPDLVPNLSHPRRKHDWRDKTISNRHWEPSPFGTTADGRLDYRGFPYPVPHYQNLQSVDLSHAQEGGGATFLTYAVMQGCDFTGAALGNVSETLIRCCFNLSEFIQVTLGGAFDGCSFVQAKLRKCRSTATFTDCDFRDANLSGTDFSWARFVRCTFDGASFKGCDLHKAVFVGCRPSEEQLAACYENGGIRFEDDSGQQVSVATPPAAEDPVIEAWDQLAQRLAGRS